MPSPKEVFDNHPIHGTLATLESQAGAARSQANFPAVESEITRLEDVLRFVDSCLKQTLLPLLNEGLLTNLDSPLKGALNELNLFLKNGNAAHVNQNARNNLNSVVQQAMLLPRTVTKKDADGLAKAANEYRDNAEQLIAGLRKERDTLATQLTSIQNDAKTLQEQITQLKTEATAEKNRLSQVIDQHQQQFSQSQQERQNQFTESLTKLKESADKINAEQKDSFNIITNDLKTKQKESMSHYEEEALKLIDILEGKRKEASDLVHVIGNIGVTGNYKKIADDEKSTADKFRNIAVGFLLLMVVAVGSIIFASIGNGVDWGAAVLRILTGLIFAVPAGYAAVESAKHRKVEMRNRRIELELASLEPFIEKLDDANKTQLRQKLSERYFGQHDQGEMETSVPPTSLIDLLRLAIDALNKKAE